MQPFEQVVERATELGELVIGAFKAESAIQIGRRDLLRRRGDRPQRPQDASRQPPGGQNRDADRLANCALDEKASKLS